MTKHPAGGDNDYHKIALMEMLDGKLTFKNAVRRKSIGNDEQEVLKTGYEYWSKHKDELTPRLAGTLACMAFWRLYDEK